YGALAASGLATAALPISVMNSRRGTIDTAKGCVRNGSEGCSRRNARLFRCRKPISLARERPGKFFAAVLSRTCRREQRCARNLVERFFNKIKHCRRVATRYDKLAANYLAFILLAP